MTNYVNPSVLAMRDTGPSPEAEITRDIVKRGLLVAPLLVAVSALVWGRDGAWSSAYGVLLILCNFILAAGIIALSARVSYGLMLGSMLFGYLIRLAIVAFAIYIVRNAEWVDLVALGMTVVVTHIGLLFWEMRYVSASLTFPGLRPANINTTEEQQ
jgi:hypothetical protein